MANMEGCLINFDHLPDTYFTPQSKNGSHV